MKVAYIKKRFSPGSLAVLEACLGIIEDYSAQGFTLSLRQLYYQLVSRNIVENNERSYKSVGGIISDARRAGLADWDMIEDRGRNMIKPLTFASPQERLEYVARNFQMDPWTKQPNYCEVMVEKQALEGVLEPVCRSLHVPLTANKGYSSDSALFEAAQRITKEFWRRFNQSQHDYPVEGRSDRLDQIGRMMESGLIDRDTGEVTDEGAEGGLPRIVVFYLGDHDPSGIDMGRDVRERLRMFSDHVPIELRRMALNMEQVDELNPPENPAKMSDSRAEEYVRKFGDKSWELDAIKPEALADLVREGINDLIELTAWRSVQREEANAITKLHKVAKNFSKLKL